MNDNRRDELHDETLSELYRQTRDVEPPAGLDRRVLEAAKSAVKPHPVGRFKARNRRWGVPLALAATVILTTGILRMADEAGEFRVFSSPEPTRSKTESAAKADSGFIGDTPLRPAERARSALPETASPAGVLSAEVPASASPAGPQDASKPEAISRSLRQESADFSVSKTAPAKPAASPPAPAAEAKRHDGIEKASPAEPEARRKRQDRSPEQWLIDIDALRRQGRTVEADASLAEFKRRYPDYPPSALEAPR